MNAHIMIQCYTLVWHWWLLMVNVKEVSANALHVLTAPASTSCLRQAKMSRTIS